jgi:hypothetical protein
MKNTDEQLNPMAYPREVNVDSTLKYMGEVITLLAKGTETNGRFAFMEVKVRPGTEPPPHIHEREHELFFVLEGAIRFYTPERAFDCLSWRRGISSTGSGPHVCLFDERDPRVTSGSSQRRTNSWNGWLLSDNGRTSARHGCA